MGNGDGGWDQGIRQSGDRDGDMGSEREGMGYRGWERGMGWNGWWVTWNWDRGENQTWRMGIGMGIWEIGGNGRWGIGNMLGDGDRDGLEWG